MNEWNLMGNDWVVNLFEQQIAHNSFHHSYLFTGPKGVGRRTFALRFAQALSCKESISPGKPCDKCRLCKQIQSMQHMDLTIVTRLEDRTQILIEQIRELQDQLKLTPYENRYRIALCVNFDDANEAAQNAFLKMLEEAPSQVILLLTASTPESLLSTIVSRCEVIRLRPMGILELENELAKKYSMESPSIRNIAHLAQGCPGTAIRFINHPEELERHQRITEESISLILADIHERVQFARSMTEKKLLEEPFYLLRVWELLWTDILHECTLSQIPPINFTFSDQISKLAKNVSLEIVGDILTMLRKAAGYLESNVNKTLLFENLLINWPVISLH